PGRQRARHADAERHDARDHPGRGHSPPKPRRSPRPGEGGRPGQRARARLSGGYSFGVGAEPTGIGDPLERAMQELDARLAEMGESACIASLPLLADEIAADAAGDDPALAAAIAGKLRARAGLNPGY